MAQKWYAIQTYQGSEQSVKRAVERLKNDLAIGDRIGELVVPTEDVIEVGKSGKSKTVERCLYPGYLFASLDLDKELQYRIQTLPRVSGFIKVYGSVGTKTAGAEKEGESKPARSREKDSKETKPAQLAESDILQILDKAKNKGPAKYKIYFDTAEQVRIIDGPFANLTAVVEEYEAATGKLRLNVSIFGRSTPVEMNYSQVQKIV